MKASLKQGGCETEVGLGYGVGTSPTDKGLATAGVANMVTSRGGMQANPKQVELELETGDKNGDGPGMIDKVERVGTAPLSIHLTGDRLYNTMVATVKHKMSISPKGPAINSNVGTKGCNDSLDMSGATMGGIGKWH